MRKMHKSRLALSVAAAIFAAGISGATHAETVAGADSDNGAVAPIVDHSNVGDVLLFPYYTVTNNHNTLVHLQNNSTAHTVIAKVRFRDYAESKDAMDHTLILSPGDIHTGYLKADAANAGLPTWVSTDSTCTSPQTGMGGTIPFPSTAATDTTSAQNANKHSGHAEVIVEGVINNSAVTTLYNAVLTFPGYSAATIQTYIPLLHQANQFVTGAKHSNNVPGSCGDVDSYFATTTANTSLSQIVALFSGPLPAGATTALAPLANAAITGGAAIDFAAVQGIFDDGVSDTANVLSGHYVLLNSASGYAAGGRPVAIQDFTASRDMVAFPAAVLNPCGNIDGNLICAQLDPHDPFPNLMNVGGVGVDLDTPANRIIAFNALEDTMSSDTVRNEWSSNPANGVDSEIVLTQPTKYAHRDTEPVLFAPTTDNNGYYGATYSVDTSVPCTSTNPAVCTAGSPTPSAANDFREWDDVDAVLGDDMARYKDATGCIDYAPSIWDREEDSASNPPVTTPSGDTPPNTTSELCSETVVFKFGTGVTDPDGAAAVDTSGVDQNFGWFNVSFGGVDVPTIGFAAWRRNFGDAALNFGQAIDNIRVQGTGDEGAAGDTNSNTPSDDGNALEN